jgi:hypothetical protein
MKRPILRCFAMNRLNLSPLPCTPPPEETRQTPANLQGFVDDAVVLALLTGSADSGAHGASGALALAADEMDFAGWSLPSAQPSRRIRTVARRPAPPELEKPGMDEPHRWWLAGLTGAISSFLISALLVSLSRHATPIREHNLTLILKPANFLTAPQTNGEMPRIAPQLTRISQDP